MQANSSSYDPSVSTDGRHVAFTSSASNLAPGDGNGNPDIFVHDFESGMTALASVDSTGTQGNEGSVEPSISSDGRFVAFTSVATNLVPGDTNAIHDVFVRDLQIGVTIRASVDSAGAQGNAMSREPSISSDGRFVAFVSRATNLAPGVGGGVDHVYLRDILSGVTILVSVTPAGTESGSWSTHPSISGDGRYVAFLGNAADFVPGDGNGIPDIFVRDLQAGVTVRASVDSAGVEANSFSYDPVLSTDGRFVTYWSEASNLVAGDVNGTSDVFVHDHQNGVTTLASVNSAGAQGNFNSGLASLSGDGRFVAFFSDATNLVPADTNGRGDVFVHDFRSGMTSRVSIDSIGEQGNDTSDMPSVSDDGAYVAFRSEATNLVCGDTNVSDDVFVHELGAGGNDVAFCFGDGTCGTCPCNNNGLRGRGCENSGSTGGAILTTTGEGDLSADTLVFTSSGERPTALTIFLQGTTYMSPMNFGDGLRCFTGPLKRLYVKSAAGGVAAAPTSGDPSVSARSSALGDTIPNDGVRYYMAYYRDPNLIFCAEPEGYTFNASNARRIRWMP